MGKSVWSIDIFIILLIYLCAEHELPYVNALVMKFRKREMFTDNIAMLLSSLWALRSVEVEMSALPVDEACWLDSNQLLDIKAIELLTDDIVFELCLTPALNLDSQKY